MEPILAELVDKLQKTFKERLISVVLYGSAATEDGKDRFSDFNVLCILKHVTPKELAESAPIFHWWREMKNPAPLLLSEAEVLTSTDCFPIEFHDMKEQHRILYGLDMIANLEIDYSFYRAQVEHELRAKLLRLRQKAAGVLAENDLLLRLMIDSVSTFSVLFRHALLLSGHEAKIDRREVIAAAREKFAVEPAPLLTLLDVREEKLKAASVQPALLFSEYLKQIETVVNAVDRMEK
jgi:predicted nucleotidyltransferase